ncbi:hypothetical protein [Pelagicoccus mobilis]|uniref:Zinc ribbon domain-containing protein n=1 Tax=Pelagicoccus mobilis TaxID=415221 RepID=A0A934RYE2_9BACT|nr:hypothetical protein [Pelagicoccus mobilis]MBK1877126.1 hypothetical protein [Pelagicoccus mobilis]
MSFKPPGECPNCGEYVEAGAVSCDSCGSCEDTGWNDDSHYDGIDLPSSSWEEEDSNAKNDSKLLSGVVTLALLAALVYVFVFR